MVINVFARQFKLLWTLIFSMTFQMVKLPNGEYATAEKVRYANMRLTLEFAANQLATGGCRSALQQLVRDERTMSS